MNRIVFILLSIIVLSFYWGSEPESNYAANEGVVLLPAPNPSIPNANSHLPNEDSHTIYPYEWKLVVKSVDRFLGGTSNAPYKDIIMENTL